MQNLNIKLNKAQKIFEFTPENKHVTSQYIFDWLNSWRNSWFFSWKSYEQGLTTNYYTNLDGFTSLKDYLPLADRDILLELILDICELKNTLANSILSIENVLLDPAYIFLPTDKLSHRTRARRKLSKNKNSPRYSAKRELTATDTVNRLGLKFIYLPMTAKPRTYAEAEASLKSLLKTIVNQLIYLDKKNRYEDLYQKLLFAVEKDLDNLASTIKSSTGKAENSRKSHSQLQAKFNLADISLPYILIALALLAYGLMYLFDLIFSGIPISIFIFLAGIIVLIFILELLLLFVPSSPYKLHSSSKSSRKANKAYTNSGLSIAETNTKLYGENISLHPLNLDRLGQLKLISGQIPYTATSSWNLAGPEFIIGSDPYSSDLYIPNLSTDSIILRIFQRAGTFYLELLASDVEVSLNSRKIFRYQDYELSDKCKIKVNNLSFAFTVI